MGVRWKSNEIRHRDLESDCFVPQIREKGVKPSLPRTRRGASRNSTVTFCVPAVSRDGTSVPAPVSVSEAPLHSRRLK
jgi:hypothetical protein